MRRCLAAGVLVFCAGAGSGEAAAQNYGAIAYSPSTKVYGWSYDYPSRSAAESAASANCGKQANDCIVALWFRLRRQAMGLHHALIAPAGERICSAR
jgi:Domain of unknown function (DUF4189)